MKTRSGVKILRHALPKMTGTPGALHVYGKPDASHMVIMSAGYPDNHSAMTPMAQRLAAESNCLVGITCPPGYDDDKELFADYPPDGFTFDDWAVSLREATKTLRQYSTRSVEETSLTGIFHDWGVVSGQMLVNQALEEGAKDLTPDRVVIYDVLMPPSRHTPNRVKGGAVPSLGQRFKIVIYQFVLAMSFVLNRYTHKYVTLPFFVMGTMVCRLLGAFPASKHDASYFRKDIRIKSLADLERLWYKGYPYFHFWSTLLSGKAKAFLAQASLPADLTKTPHLYLYGASKPFEVSAANGVAQLALEQDAGRASGVVRVEDAGHWLYVQQPDLCHQHMTEFFKKTGV